MGSMYVATSLSKHTHKLEQSLLPNIFVDCLNFLFQLNSLMPFPCKPQQIKICIIILLLCLVFYQVVCVLQFCLDRSNSCQMSTFDFQHFLCNEFQTFFFGNIQADLMNLINDHFQLEIMRMRDLTFSSEFFSTKQ